MASGRTVHADAFMRPLVVVDATKVIEDALLMTEARTAVEYRTLKQRAMHPLVAAVLFRVAGCDEDGLNVEFHQSHSENREPTKTVRTEWRAVVTQNRSWKPMLAKDAFDLRPNELEAN